MISANIEANLITREKGEEHYLKIEYKVFVLAENYSGLSLAVILSNLEVTQENFQEFLRFAKSYLKTSDVKIKVVGPEFLVDRARTAWSSIVNDIKYVPRSEIFELVYLPGSATLRASKESKVDTRAKVEVKNDGPLKVLVVDDSKTIRNLLTKIIESDPKLKVIATAEHPGMVEELIQQHSPDVITLDIHMPQMTGVELLKKIYPKYKIPTIMITSISLKEGPLVFEALENGAFDYIQKPEMSEIKIVAPVIIEKLKIASRYKSSEKKISSVGNTNLKFNTDSLVLIGSSTGGTNAIKDILVDLPKDIPPVLIVQHIPEVFSKAFADRMNLLCPFKVKEAEHGDEVIAGRILVAPGGRQMKLMKEGSRFFVEINDDEPVNRFRPSVDYLFDSCVEIARKRHTVGIILTGMGKDGAQGLLKLRNAGALTIAQDEETSVVYGMPKEAAEIGAAVSVDALENIGRRMIEFSHPEAKNKKAS